MDCAIRLYYLPLVIFMFFYSSNSEIIPKHIELEEKGNPVELIPILMASNSSESIDSLPNTQGRDIQVVLGQKRQNKSISHQNNTGIQTNRSEKISDAFFKGKDNPTLNSSPGAFGLSNNQPRGQAPTFVIQAPVIASLAQQKEKEKNIDLTDRLIGNILSPIFSLKKKPQKQVVILSATSSTNSTLAKNPQINSNRPLTTQQFHSKITNNIINNIFTYLIPKPDPILYDTSNGEKIKETNKINFTSNSKQQVNSTEPVALNKTQTNTAKKGIRIPLRDGENITSDQPENPSFDDSNKQNSSQTFIGQANLKYENYLIKYKPNQKTQKQDIIVYRQTIFNLNVKNINQHNLNPLKAFTKGVNAFTDLSPQQFERLYAKLLLPTSLITEPQNENTIVTTPPKIKIDWSCRAGDLISQGICGVCHVITAVQSIQIGFRIFGFSIPSRSIQQVMSCSNRSRDDMRGCGGGYFTGAYDYVKQNGVGQSSMYPYDDQARFNSILSDCNRSKINSQQYRKDKISIIGSNRIKYGDCEQIVKQLEFRPIAVAIASSGLQLYNDGVFSEPTHSRLNHGVVLVGYDYNLWPGGAYLIKNTWGNSWGNQGYAYISNKTGLCKFAMYPVLNITQPLVLQKCQKKNNN